MSWRRLLLVGVAVLASGSLVFVPHASAAGESYGVDIDQQMLGADGNPSLIANFQPDGSLATPSWAICAPAVPGCVPTGVTNQVYRPGPEPAGTAFQASAVYRGVTYTASTGPWQGAVAATAPPTLTGVPRVGAVVTPHAGSWTGGWGGELDLARVEACRTRDGRGCTTISYPHAFRNRYAARIDARWSGAWLFALDERFARDTAWAEPAYLYPFGIPPLAVGPTLSRSAPLGPVTGPALRLRDHPLLLRDGRLLVGRATCPRGCDAGLRVIAAGGHARSARLRVHGTRGLAVPAGDLGFEHGARIRIRIGTTPLVETFASAGQVVAAGLARR